MSARAQLRVRGTPRPGESARAQLRVRETLRRVRRAVSLTAAACAALLLGACGPPPPQVPLAQQSTVGNALTGIITACGESYQQHAFSAHPDVLGLEASAAVNARALAAVVVHDPAWIFQGETLDQIVGLSIRYLDDCALTGAARVLQRDARRR